MRLRTLFICVWVITSRLAFGTPVQQKFDKAEFYSVMKSGDMEAVENEMEAIKTAPENEREGYLGALLLRKAGLAKKAKERLKLFKEGRAKLENAIVEDSDNTEFRFLRLAVQEHAPKIVKYHSDIDKDKVLVVKNYKSMAPAAQHAVLDYCSNSKVLHKDDF